MCPPTDVPPRPDFLLVGTWFQNMPTVRHALAQVSAWRNTEGVPGVFITNDAAARMVKGKIRLLTVSSLGDLLAFHGNWRRLDTKADRDGYVIYLPASPPREALAALLESPEGVDGESPLPHLDTIVSCPIVLPDNRVVDRPGYLEKHGILSKVPELPVVGLDDAIVILDDAFGGFKYADDRAKAHAYAALFTGPLRSQNPNILPPLLAISKSRAGTGASTLLEAFASLTMGKEMESTHWCDNPAEMDKLLASRFLAGDNCILFDNVINPCESPSISTLITSGHAEVRILGVSKMVRNEGPVTLFMSSNRADMGEDYADRILQIELDWGGPKPKEVDLSKVFEHHPFKT